MNEVDTCRKLVLPRLLAAGWDSERHSIAEQRTITDGRIVPAGRGFIRKPPRRVDYLLRHTRDFPLAVVEAKPGYKAAADGLQQARDYAEMLGLKFAYATNGYDIVEFDYARGLEQARSDQQRVTALIAALLGREVLTKDCETVRILIAFNPQEERLDRQRARRCPLVLVGSRVLPCRGGGRRVV